MLASLLGLMLPAGGAQARNLLSADGPGGTYELIRTAYTTELPDCGHMVPHITEEPDSELGKNVFVFHAHVNQDDDRCGSTDRQRTEIRGRSADIVANNGETVYYRWKFKLAAGFQGASSFTHIFQIKSDLGAPVMTLTPRTSTMAIDGRIGARGTTSLSKFIGVWVVVDLKVLFSNDGNLQMTIRRLSDGEVLFSYAGAADMWDDGANPHDPKFGIYRSLGNRGSLRDEQVRFADFCVSKQSANECAQGSLPPPDAGAEPPPVDAGAEADAGPLADASAGGPEAADVASPPPTPDASGGVVPVDAGADTAPRPPSRSDAASPTAPAGQGASGCSCRLASAGQRPGGPAALALLALVLGIMRRRRAA